MKKILLATTALIAASAFATPAQAELQITVGGFTSFQAAMFDTDLTNGSDRDFTSESKIIISADGVAANGLEYGARILLNASTSPDTNSRETVVYLAGSWGRVELGDNDGASELNVFAPTVGIGQINGSYDDFINSSDKPFYTNDRGHHTFTAFDTANSTKVTYYTPKFSGFQAGLTYAPGATARPNLGVYGETVNFLNNDNQVNDAFEIGAGYDGDFNGVMVKVGGGYNYGEAANTGREDLNAWSLGAQLGYKGFRIGGGYTDNGDSLNNTGLSDDDATLWNVGMTYETGPWGVGVSYLDADIGTNGYANAGTPGDITGGDYSAVVMGGTYAIAPGLTVGADLAFWERNRPAAADTNGYVLMTDVTAAF